VKTTGNPKINTSILQPATISWNANGLPESTEYGDIYFSAADPVAESRHVFLQGNALKERLSDQKSTRLVIGECGFGFGLNFLLTLDLYASTKTQVTTLHYISSELHPVSKTDLERLYSKLSLTFQEHITRLMAVYPEQGKGIHRMTFTFPKGLVILDLLYGDAAEMFSALETPSSGIDIWYLDGFSPVLNSVMWEADLFLNLARLSKTGTTLSTYSVSGNVRRNLERAGFDVVKTAGFGNKRHMLKGSFKAKRSLQTEFPWHRPWSKEETLPQRVAVIGAGMAGCATAHALARRGYSVSLFDKGKNEASAASGNTRGVVHFKPFRRLTPAGQLHLHAFLHACRFYSTHPKSSAFDWQNSGVQQLALSEDEQSRQKALLECGIYDQELIRESETFHGFLVPAAGSLNPASLCRILSDHEHIEKFYSHEVSGCKYTGSSWELQLDTNKRQLESSYDAVIICTNQDAENLDVLPDYPLVYNHGQVDNYACDAAMARLDNILCHKGYAIPWEDSGQPMVTIGGSYMQGKTPDPDLELLRKRNLSLAKNFPGNLFTALSTHNPVSSRLGIRSTTKDYLPLVGPVEDRSACALFFADLKRNARKTIPGQAPLLSGLYINTGHGSHGLTTTPLAAEILASIINRESLPVTSEVFAAIHPLRFLIRDLKKQK